jgi:hypothetical protein
MVVDGTPAVVKSLSVHGATEVIPAARAAVKTRARYAACSLSLPATLLRPTSPMTREAGAAMALARESSAYAAVESL